MIDINKLQGHEKIVYQTILDLFDFIPEKYAEYDLPYLTVFKTAIYNGSIEPVFRRYFILIRFFDKYKIPRSISRILSFAMLKVWCRKFKNRLNEPGRKSEFEIDWETKKKQEQPNGNGPYDLFVASMPTYTRVIAEYISNDPNKNNLIVIPRCHINLKSLDKIRDKVLIFEDFIESDFIEKMKTAQFDFRKIFEENEEKISKIFRYDSSDFYSIFRNGIRNVFCHIIPNSILYFEIAQKLMSEIDVKSVIAVRQKRTFENAFMLVAKNKNKKRFQFVHGNIFNEKGHILTFGHFSGLDGLFVWGNEQRDNILNNYDSTGTKIYAFGSPLFKTKKQKGVQNKARKQLLYAVGKSDDKEIKILLKVARKFKSDLKLLLKVHPRVDDNKYKKYCSAENVELISESELIEDYLPASDLFLSKQSTVGIQAMVQDIPTMYMVLDKRTRLFLGRFYKFSAVQDKYFVGYSSREIFQKISKIIFSNQYLKEHMDIQKEYIDNFTTNRSVENESLKLISGIINR